MRKPSSFFSSRFPQPTVDAHRRCEKSTSLNFLFVSLSVLEEAVVVVSLTMAIVNSVICPLFYFTKVFSTFHRKID